MNSKVAIVGAEAKTRDKAPYNDLSYDIWSFSDWVCSDWLKRCNALIEIHTAIQYMQHPRTDEYWDVLQEIQFPVYMYPIADPRVPGSKPYPLEGVLSMLGASTEMGKKLKPLNSTIAYAIALAIFQGYDVVEIYGAELANTGEYMSQTGTFAFWNGVAVGRGVELRLNCSEGLLVHPLYGFEDELPKAKIYKYMQAVNEQLTRAKKEELMAMGALQLARKLIND